MVYMMLKMSHCVQHFVFGVPGTVQGLVSACGGRDSQFVNSKPYFLFPSPSPGLLGLRFRI